MMNGKPYSGEPGSYGHTLGLHDAPPPPAARVTVIEQFYHQRAGYDPTSVETRFTANLASKEQPYIRHVTIGEDWVKLDTGWLSNSVAMVIISNNKPRRQYNPTPREISEDAGKVIELAFSPNNGLYPILEIPLGEGQRIRPVDIDRWMIRCREGETEVSIYAYPK